MSNSQDSTTPAQDAVIAFVGFVRAIRAGDRERQRSAVRELDAVGLSVRAKRCNRIAETREARITPETIHV